MSAAPLILLLTTSAAAVLADRQYTIVDIAGIIEDALADVAVAGASGEQKEATTVARARRFGESHGDEPIDDCEIAGIRVVLAVQLGLAAVGPAVDAIVGQGHAVRAVELARLGYGHRPVAAVALRHAGAGRQCKGFNWQHRCDESANVPGHCPYLPIEM